MGIGDNSTLDENTKPGEYVLQTLFLELCTITERKVEQVLAEPLERPLTKSLQRGDDQQFDQLLTSLSSVAEQCLPSLLRSLFRWYERQYMLEEGSHGEVRLRHKSKGGKDYLCERRDLAVEFVYCLVLIEVLTKLSYHPGHDDLVRYIINQAFRHFKYKDGLQTNPNAANINIIADLYAEVIGVLAMSRFTPVKKTFLSELKELKLRDHTPYTAQSIISLLMGLKFFRVKMHPIEDFEACVQFLHELGHYFLEVKDRDIKHALASLFVEILLPVAAKAKNEVNVPVLKNFVDMMYNSCVDMTTKKKQQQHVLPLVTCLLCVSQKNFFLSNWPYFLTTCLSQLKHKDAKMSRVSLESLYRLLWVYMVRIKCESNTATTSRLQSIVSSLFPKGSKVVTPRDMPLNIFVKIIQFIATERLDFAMKEIIFDLLSIGKQAKFMMNPERMSIGLRAFLVIADNLQQGDGDPPMPQSGSALPSGSTVRVKKTFLNKMLTEATAKSIGLAQYIPHLLKTFDSMLRGLDLAVGRPLLLTKAENTNKEPEELLTGDRKPKMDLFRTCIAAIPRLIPDGMSKMELVELVTRLTVHFDEELRGLAFQALQNLMQESSLWRDNVIRGFVQFVQKDISDTNTQQLDSALRLLMQLLTKFSNLVTQQRAVLATTNVSALHEVEGLALVMLCSHRPVTRKLAAHLLKEVCLIFSFVQQANPDQAAVPCMLEVMDAACQTVVERLLPSLPSAEKPCILNSPCVDLQWVLDRSASVWNSSHDNSHPEPHSESTFGKVDPWMQCIASFVSKEFAMTQCPLAVAYAWPIVYSRLNAVYTLLDPNTMINENRTSSLLRGGGSKKENVEKDQHMHLWQNYVILACSIVQKGSVLTQRCASPDPGSSPETEKADAQKNDSSMVSGLFHLLVPLMKCESSDMRDTIVNGLGYTNPAVFKEFMEEMLPYLKEAIERKTETIKRRRKRDVNRLQLAHIFELMAEHKTFAQWETGVIDKDGKCLSKTFVEYIDGARLFLEGESDRDLPILQDIRLHFSKFVRHLICNTPAEYKKTLLTRDLKYSLFDLFASWSGKFSHTFSALDKRLTKEDSCTILELEAVRAMSAVVCCGPVFDSNGLNDDGYIYHWLDTLLSSHDDRIYELAKETVVLLLDFNTDTPGLLDWVIDRCYTGTNEVSDGCFNALAAVFQTREYPCDHVAMLNLAVLNVGNPRVQTHETAVQLLNLLDRRFFQEESVLGDNSEEHQPINDVKLSVSYCKSQICLSEQLARIHPELTMPIFSEITHRFQTAKPAIRQSLLRYLLPWLHNMELMDPSLPQSSPLSNFLVRLHDNYNAETFKPPLKGEGWGSPEATKMVLNNLFYITVKFGDDHAQELELLWAALVVCWPNNLKVVMHYLIIITNMAATELLPYAKRVGSYMGRAKPERLVDELMSELQTVETLNMNIERTQTPPFFHLSQIKRSTLVPNITDDEKLVSHASECALEKGTLHTKRHSANDDLPNESTPRTDSTQSLRESDSSDSSEDEISIPSPVRNATEAHRTTETQVPYPLPMPAYGGYFAPLTEYLPETVQPSSGFHRSNIAIMFISDLVTDGLQIDWSAHLPTMLHVIFLGLDHNRELVYEHCKKLLLNLMLLAAHMEQPDVARLLLRYQSNLGDTLQLISESKEPATSDTENQTSDQEEPAEVRPVFRVDSSLTLTPGTPTTPLTPEQPSSSEITESDPLSLNSILDVVKAILEVMSKRRCRPLWCYEDITPKTLVNQSATQLEYMLKLVVKFFKHLSPHALVEQRWSQVAMQLALSCSSRHYAGRSFQVLRALHIRPTSQMLSDILSRLVETVAEQGEDMQGYVTEIILTLEAVVDNLDLEVLPIDYMREIFMSTPNLAKEQGGAEVRRSVMMGPKFPQQTGYQHARSTSYCIQSVTSKMALSSEVRLRSATEIETRLRSNMPRSRSEKSLKNSEQGVEDKLTIVTQMFWIAVSLFESDYEYEFLLATRLLDKILQHLQPDRPECREKLEKIQQSIKWTNFPGVQTLLLKGCTSQMTAESSWQLLTRLTVCISSPVVDPTGNLGFPMNVVALLPYLVHHYESPSQSCKDAADHIAQICAQKSERLNNLGTVMSLYSRGTFGKDGFQWTKCVIKYLHDVYASASLNMVTFLVDVLEKGPVCYQLSILQILHCLVHYIDLSSQPVSVLNSELFRTVSRHVEGPHWKEAIKILKLTVARSSTLAAVPPSGSGGSESTYVAHSSFADVEVIHKKELPGRTLDFSVDLSGTAIIGRRFVNPEVHGTTEENIPSNQSSLSRKGSYPDADTCWKKPQLSQARTRERLTELLSCYGQKRLPKSPSVIFSQSSDTLDHQQSIASSGEDSIPDATLSNDALYSDSNGTDLIHMTNMTIKNFDFLDNELYSNESTEDYFSQFDNRRHSFAMDSPEPEHSRQRAQFGSTPDLKQLGNPSLSELPTHGRSTESISLKEETLSGHESTASAPDTDGMPTCMTPCASSVIVIQNSGLMEVRESSPLTASTHSLQSISSDPELLDLNSSATSSNFPNFPTSYLYMMIQNDEVEDIWRQHVDRVIAESSVANTINTSQIFPRLYRELRRRLATITKDANYYIAKTDGLRKISAQFLQVLDTMFTHLECPYFFTETEILMGSRVVDRHKYCLLEMQECFSTYSMKKDQAEQSLESIKSSIKQQSLGDGGNYPAICSDDQKLDLCRKLYSLVFQLVMLFESYLKLLENFRLVQGSPQVVDMSLPVSGVKGEITAALGELENGQVSPLNVDSPKSISKQEAFSSVMEYLRSQQYQKAVQLLRSFRAMWPGDMFGQSTDDDVITLLNMYCGGLAEKKTGLFVLTRIDFDIGMLYSQLMEINLQLRNWSPAPQPIYKADSIDMQDSSTL